MIKRIGSNDIKRVAQLHGLELTGFLPELGEKFLMKFYRESLNIPEMFTFIYISKNKISGFVTGITSAGGLLKKIILKDLLGFGLLLGRYFIAHPIKLIKLFQIMRYPGFSQGGAELLTIAVDRKFQRRGIGGKLFSKTVNEFRRRNIGKFKISVYERLPANKFYLKMGCKRASSFEFLSEKMSYYLYNIDHRTMKYP